MARCPSCRQEVSSMYCWFYAWILLRNMFRSPDSRILVCRNCGEELALTLLSFILCQIAWVATLIPCAIVCARLERLLVDSTQLFNHFSRQHPLASILALWVLPTLVATLFIHNAAVKHLIEFKRAS